MPAHAPQALPVKPRRRIVARKSSADAAAGCAAQRAMNSNPSCAADDMT
jgi:hypothetical protein